MNVDMQVDECDHMYSTLPGITKTVLRENYELYQEKKNPFYIANLYHGNSRQIHNDCNHASENSTRCVLLLSHIYSSRE